MSDTYTILLLEDEPVILMDLELAAEDRGCTVFAAASCSEARTILESGSAIDMAVLDVSLGSDGTCVPVARELEGRSVPYVLHSGDLDRLEEVVGQLDAPLIAKPAAAEKVIAAVIALFKGKGREDVLLAAE